METCPTATAPLTAAWQPHVRSEIGRSFNTTMPSAEGYLAASQQKGLRPDPGKIKVCGA
jgi:hypothetical protein